MSQGDDATEKKRIAGRRRISPADLKRIVEIVRHWPQLPITWDLIQAKLATDFKLVPDETGSKRNGLQPWSRQALSARPAIKKAYQDRKVELEAEQERVERRPTRNRDPEVVMMRREVEALRIEVKELKAELAVYEERYGTMVYNRALGARTEEEQTRALQPKVDRQGREKK